MTDVQITFAVLAGVVILFMSGRVPVEIVAIGAAVVLYVTDVLSVQQALAGFGDPTVIFIASLFVVSEALDSSGVTTWAGQQLIARTGDDRTRLIVLMMAMCALLTALINPNGSVAALVPVVVITAMRLGKSPSQLLMPLAFAAHSGSLLALTGTPVNIIVSDASADAGAGSFGFFEFAIVGLPLVIGTVGIVLLFGERLLPQRSARTISADFSNHARTFVNQYGLEPSEPVFTKEMGLAEVVIPPRSGLIGQKAFPGMVTESGDLVIAAIQRKGEDLGPREVTLAAGDTLLLEGSWRDLEVNLDDPDVLVVDPPGRVRRQVVALGPGWIPTVIVIGAMVVMLASGEVPPAVAGLVSASALVLLGVVKVDEAYRAISWTTVILVGGLISLSTAMIETGAADDIAKGLVDTVGDHGAYPVLIALFLLTVCFGQLISNTATALIVTPIAVLAAAELDVSPVPLLMTVTIAAAASFLTPVATPANLMVMGPGGYKFGDYWKLGLPMVLLYLIVAVALVPLFWPY